jgi:arabinose-5-phosphate isomerase
MLKKLIDKQRRYINTFFDQLQITEVEKLFEVMLQCKGIIFFTGVGKSGIIAKKIAMTMVSTGTKALYLDPMNAIHGDLGIVTENDVFLMFSKSGETEELLTLLPCLRNRKTTLVSITCNTNSRLDKGSDLNVTLPLERELCPFGLAPTTSTAIQLIFGDLLAVALMEKKEFSLNEYALNHPGGSLGKKMTMRVRDIMLAGEDVPYCLPNDSLSEVLVELTNKGCGCVLVIDSAQELQGIFTDGDLRRVLQSKGPQVLEESIGKLMSSKPRCIDPYEMAVDAAKCMEEDQKRPIMMLPVVTEQGKVVGLVRMHDLLQSGLEITSSLLTPHTV